MKRGKGLLFGLSPRKGVQNGPSPSPFLSPFQCEINRNWSLAKGRGMPAKAAGSLAGVLSQEKNPDCDLHSPTWTLAGILRPSLILPLPVLGLFSERWAAETELPP